jgi:hypothetical protein
MSKAKILLGLDASQGGCNKRGYGDRKVELRTVSLLSGGATAEMAPDDWGSKETMAVTRVARASAGDDEGVQGEIEESDAVWFDQTGTLVDLVGLTSGTRGIW